MKFTLRRNGCDPIVLSWKPGVDVHGIREALLAQLRELKVLVDAEFDHEIDWPEVTWVNEHITTLEKCGDLDPNSEAGIELISEFLAISAIHEELDRLVDSEANGIVRNLKWIADNSIARDWKT